MKTPRLVFATIVSAGLLCSPICTAQDSSDGRSAAHSSNSINNRSVGAALRPHARSASGNKSGQIPVPVAVIRRSHRSGAHNQQLRTANAPVIETTGILPNRTVTQIRPPAIKSATRSYAPSLSAPHRASNPAVIGEPVIVHKKNGSVLDGTQMRRKP
jgi:hypothetical protein